MVSFIPEDERRVYSHDDIVKVFLGKFVLLTNVKFTEFMGLIEGVAVLTADRAYENVRDGIYDKFDDKDKYGIVYGYDLSSLKEISN